MSNFGVKDTIDSLHQTIYDYLTTEYFGKNDALRECCKGELEKEGTLFRQAYIEANNAYKSIPQGISSCRIPTEAKKLLAYMANNNLGVYQNPYQHQIEALEAFYAGKDLFISTGTGSGKTECFLWPLISSLILERSTRPNSWQQRGIRAILLYPMNALVNDQIGRLRKIIGNEAEKFHNFLERENSSLRHPQFGMYTGRTPYPGNLKKREQKELSEALRKSLFLNEEDPKRKEEAKKKLQSLGKYPSKFNLEDFIDNLEAGLSNPTNPKDAELITRHEMQISCPDILITNYSMLDFMMVRKIEQDIWEQTKCWFEKDKRNKLLFIIDEAHKYKGSAGAEVALLIRRVLHKLGIPRSRVQFILTTASIPAKETAESELKKFACDLTSQQFEMENFEFIRGVKAELPQPLKNFSPEIFKDVSLEDLYGDVEQKELVLQKIGRLLGWKQLDKTLTPSDIQNWLFENLIHSKPCQDLLNLCRGRAISFERVANEVFPQSNSITAQKALEVLLAIMPMAKATDENVLFPARLHLFFRGLNGVYACSNPNCLEHEHTNNLGIGKVFLSYRSNRCKCGALIYQLLNERSCGALFLHGFMEIDSKGDKYIWNQAGRVISEDFCEIHFYIVPKNTSFKLEKGQEHGWLNSKTGILKDFPPSTDAGEYLEVIYCLSEENKGKKQKGELYTFKSCPKCGKRNCNVTGFKTRGNEPFYNLIKEQFYHQPAVQASKDLVNQGRKVLLFSDSRQKAALLARDLTRAADLDAMRKIICLAVEELQTNAQKYGYEPNLSMLYPAFLKVVYDNKLHLFFGEDKNAIEEKVNIIKEKIERATRRNRNFRFDAIQPEFNSPPDEYFLHLLNLLCNNFGSLSDHALCWLEPCNGAYDDLKDSIEDKFERFDINLTFEEFKGIFTAWALEICKDSLAIFPNVDKEVREELSKFSSDFGLSPTDKEKWPPRLKKILMSWLSPILGSNIESKLLVILDCLSTYLSYDKARYYLNDETVKLCQRKDKAWYKCNKCGGISPFLLGGTCPKCGALDNKRMEDFEFESLSFWRNPVIKALEKVPGVQLTRINTEEHTAQLSHRDQRQKLWSTTENFEMRFQNVFIDDNEPVDILSCTTTMEVGIDIGSLTAIGLRNIPPTRENYQQRAGRAGRKGASVSTILTYADNRPHDNYYFHHPERIIASEPSAPWIDVTNKRLLLRHLAVTVLARSLLTMGIDIAKEAFTPFFVTHYKELMKEVLRTFVSLTQEESGIGLVEETIAEELKDSLLQKLEDLHSKYRNHENSDDDRSLLDTFVDEGIFPSYSFPRDVIGFHIFDVKGNISQRPDRSLEMALSEYAPGRTVVVNKNTYVSGGIFSSIINRSARMDSMAEPYFKDRAFFKEIQVCSNPACNWMGIKNQKKDEKFCPFCLNETLVTANCLKPWGFAPKNGQSVRVIKAENDYTEVTKPAYSLTPREEEMKVVEGSINLRYARKISQPLLILNKGQNDKGFMVCRLCGAAVPGDDPDVFYKKHILRPYLSKNGNIIPCRHIPQNVFLGGEILTDLILYEIKIEEERINTDPENLWINRAAQSLAESLVLAASRILDIEFNEIRSGFRIRRTNSGVTFVDIYLFDSLTSGAGYSSSLENRTKELFAETKQLLNSCPSSCESACHDCLKNYWNQQVHDLLDRFAALQLIDWCQKGEVAKDLPMPEQKKLLAPLEELDTRWKIVEKSEQLFLKKDGEEKLIVVHPAMQQSKPRSKEEAIYVPDLYLRYALPLAERKIEEQWR